ncbi:hypothetical protein BVRB_006310 [Beta vulgaris subsp. vulgaris]|uniref:Aconitase A/isopropylmalate dehydratase small subunit swivel domain-containing protein n=1 Tax=Beta vulgaris subsp. vulgaris TaxID=3555 RepID=A0A0J8B3T7_BETVV|nr:hypothetical protein BVRB_006310 [Beta vulgaris subsp. vulgaris]
MATASHIISSTNSILTFHSPQKPSIFLHSPSSTKLPTTFSTQIFTTTTPQLTLTPAKVIPSTVTSAASTDKFYGVCYVVRDDIDTDQIIPTEYTTLNPSDPEDYKKLGSYALVGLPSSYALRFIEEDGFMSKYSIIIAGRNFGCGSLREVATVALNAAGVKAVVAESFDEIFLKSCVSNGQLFPLESKVRICEEFKTGDVATVDIEERILTNQTTGKVYQLKA